MLSCIDYIKNIYRARSLVSFLKNWPHSNKAVQEAALLIISYVNNKTLITKQKYTKWVVAKFFKT